MSAARPLFPGKAELRLRSCYVASVPGTDSCQSCVRVSRRHARRYSSAIGRPTISKDNTTAGRCNEWRECMFRTALLVVLVSTAVPLGVLAQTPADLKNDANTPDDVLVYGMGYSGQRYSPLTQINKQASWSRSGAIRSRTLTEGNHFPSSRMVSST